jgi:hypothetical protein
MRVGADIKKSLRQNACKSKCLTSTIGGLKPLRKVRTMQRTTPLGQTQLEQSLTQALDEGINAIPEQIKLLLAYSQMLALPSRSEPYTPKPLTVVQARLAAVISFAQNLKPSQAQAFYRNARLIHDLNVRLSFQTRLLRHLGESDQQSAVQELLAQVDLLEDPVQKSRILLNLAEVPSVVNARPNPLQTLPDIVQLAGKIAGAEARVRSMATLALNVTQDTTAAQVFEQVLNDIDATPNDALRSNTLSLIAPKVPPKFHPRLLSSAEKIRTPSERARTYTVLAQVMPNRTEIQRKALEAVSLITNEEECVEALVSFAPSLEEASAQTGYPETLQEALRIAIGLTRRPLRARALVALAPHLTPDLQGEALAAVHSLSNDRDRAALLAELAPALPADMLVASLAVAHTMREQDARAHALNILAHHVPPHARQQTILDALAAASNLPHHFERVRALVSLYDVLPPTLQEQAFTNALETTRLIENENARARALSLLSHHLPAHLLERSLDLAYQISDLQQRLNTLISISSRLEGEKREEALAMMLDCARQMPFEYRRARALVSIATYLTPQLLPEVQTIADTLHDPLDKASVYIALAQNLPPEERSSFIISAWTLLRKIEDGYDRASALVAIAPFLPAPARADLVKMAREVVEAITDEYDRASAITILVPLLIENDTPQREVQPLPTSVELLERGIKSALDAPNQFIKLELLAQSIPSWLRLKGDEQYRLWKEIAQRLKTLPLADVLLCLSLIVPVIRALGGEETVEKVTEILSVQRGGK